MSDKKDFTDKSKNSNDTFCCIYCTERNDCSVLSVKNVSVRNALLRNVGGKAAFK